MPYFIGSGGGNLYKIDVNGTATLLTLPSGVTIDQTKATRMVTFGKNIVVVNSPSRSLWVDPNGNVRPLTLRQPTIGQLVVGNAGGLTGTYQFKYSFIVKDPNTNALLMESDFSAPSASLAVTAQMLQANITRSEDAAVTGRRLYRTTTGPGASFFKWIDTDDNSVRSVQDDMPDTLLSNIAAPTELGSGIGGAVQGTHMTLITEWRNRLWTVTDTDIDTLRYSGNGIFYGWPTTYGLSIAPPGEDQFGITGIMPRREYLGVARRKHFWRISFQGVNADGTPNFISDRVKVGKGCFAPDSAQVIDDVAYFLGEDGIYAWGSQYGEFVCLSDRSNVRKWFATDNFFNRNNYPNAVGRYNQQYHRYELFLSNVGSTSLDRWVEYDIGKGQFFGPHLTNGFTPSWAATVIDPSTTISIPFIGGTDGNLYTSNRSTFNDNGIAIPMDWIGKMHDCGAPDISKAFFDMAVINRPAATAGNLVVNFKSGDENLLNSGTITGANLTSARQRLTRVGGPARLLQLEFIENTVNQPCEIQGYEIPYIELGRR